MTARRRAVFIDRDGVLSVPEFRDGRSYAPTKMARFRLYPEAPGAVMRLKDAGLAIVVVTNQPDVGRGLISTADIEGMHRELSRTVPVDRIEACFHHSGEPCECRKPLPGMLLNAARYLDIDLSSSFMVGDRASDVEAGRAAGCRTVFIDLKYTAEPLPVAPDHICKGIAGAADWILTQCA